MIKRVVTEDFIVNYMDKAYAEFVEKRPDADLSRVTVLIHKDDFDVLEKYSLARARGDVGPNARLTGYCSVNAPWGSKLSHSDKVKLGEAMVVDL